MAFDTLKYSESLKQAGVETRIVDKLRKLNTLMKIILGLTTMNMAGIFIMAIKVVFFS